MSTIDINLLSEDELDLIIDRAPQVEPAVCFGFDLRLHPVADVETSEDPETWWVVTLVTLLSTSGAAFRLPVLYPSDVAIGLGFTTSEILGAAIEAALVNLNTTQEGTDQ